MDALAPSSIVIRVDQPACWMTGALAAAAIACAIAAPVSPTATLGLLAASLAVGWMAAATLVTWLCRGHGLMLEPPDLNGDFHALSGFRVRFRVGNSRRWPVLFLTVWFDTTTDNRPLPSPPKFVGRLDPGSVADLSWSIIVRRRGPYHLVGARAQSAFPGSLIAYEYGFSFVSALLALPAIYRLDRRALALLTGRRLAGGRLHANPASMEEFIGVRDYRPGDSPRHIHFALSLRAPDYPNQLVVREFEDPTDDDVCVVLDSAIAPAQADNVLAKYRHEKSLSFAVALCRLLTEQRYRVRFRAVRADGQTIDLLLDRSQRDLPRLETELAQVAPTPDRTPIRRMLDEETRRSNAAVLFVSLRDVPEEKRHPRLVILTLTPDWQASLVREVSAL